MSEGMKQPQPRRKITVGVVAGAVTTVLAVVLRDAFGYDASAELQGAVTTILMAGAMLVMPERSAS